MTSREKIRVLVVDDSFFMRKLLKELLSDVIDIEVVGEAKNGAEAVAESIKHSPDVITMDYNMPEMTGAEAVRKIIEVSSKKPPRIIMLSAYVQDGANESLECLRAGAVDLIAKPSGELSLDIDTIRDEIISKIRTANKATVRISESVNFKDYPVRKRPKGLPSQIVVIGSSTGGPPVVEDLVRHLPDNLNAAILVIQHMPEAFTGSFASRLDKLTPLTIKEAQNGDFLQKSTIYIAHGGYHLRLKKVSDEDIRIQLTQDEPEHGLRPAIDVTMRDAAEIFGESLVGIVLTGMGDDGALGLKVIHKNGGHTIVQDPKTATIDSMPQSAIETGGVDEILKPIDISKKIVSLVEG